MDASSPLVRFRCPACARGLAARPDDAGRKTSCPSCGQRVVVPGALEATGDADQAGDAADLVGVDCRLCRTRMYVARRHIGRRVRCPDCETVNEVVAPAPAAPRRAPPALEGEQYQVYDGDEQPWGVDLAAAEPRYLAVVCGVCQTRMHALPEQVGKPISCPDCGAKAIVREPAAEKPVKRWVEGDGEDLDVEAPVDTSELHAGLYEAALAAPPLEHRLRQEEDKARAERGEKARGTGRPQAPRMAQWVGVARVLRDPRLMTAFAVLAVFDALAALLISGALGTTLMPGLLAAVPAFITLSTLLTGVILQVLVLGCLATVGYAVVEASASGEDRVDPWPLSDLSDWMPSLPAALLALAASFGPGASFALAAPESVETLVALFGGLASAVVLHGPIVLSQLAGGSAASLLAPEVRRSLRRAPLAWATYIAQAVVVWSAALAVLYGLTRALGPLGAALSGGAEVAAVLLCARLLGRLGWVLADRLDDSPRVSDSD